MQLPRHVEAYEEQRRSRRTHVPMRARGLGAGQLVLEREFIPRSPDRVFYHARTIMRPSAKDARAIPRRRNDHRVTKSRSRSILPSRAEYCHT